LQRKWLIWKHEKTCGYWLLAAIKMKYLLILLLIGANPIDSPSCKSFAKGTFVFNSPDGTMYKIIRTKNKQIEVVAAKNLQSEFELKWIDECTYILFNRQVTKGVDQYPQFNKDTLYNQITQMSKTKYKVSSWMKGTQKVEIELTKLK
jgi:hypothetical protein